MFFNIYIAELDISDAEVFKAVEKKNGTIRETGRNKRIEFWSEREILDNIMSDDKTVTEHTS